MKLLLLFLSLSAFTSSRAQSLKPKQNFGNNGKIAVNLGNEGPMYPICLAQQPDGKVVVGGTGLARIDNSGNVDNNFGMNGFIATGEIGDIHSVDIQADGKIIAASFSSFSQVCILRYKASGLPDSSFGNNGRIIFETGTEEVIFQKIKIQPDGKILVLGYKNLYTPVFSRYIYMARFTSNGNPDLTFNGSGNTSVVMSENASGTDFSLQSNGKIIIAGTSPNINLNKIIILRLNVDGTRDMTFNGNGLAEYASPGLNEYQYPGLLYVYPDDRILMAGASGSQLLLIRLQSDGARDNSFNGNGISLTNQGTYNKPTQIHLLDNQKIIITGQISFSTTGGFEFGAYQFSSSGLPDTAFNGDGTTYLFSPDSDIPLGSKINTDGSLFIFGFREPVSLIVTARVNSDGTFDMSHGINGLRNLFTTQTDEFVKKTFKQADGKLLLLSTKYTGEVNRAGMVFTRLDPTGNIDNAFGTNGHIFYGSNAITIEDALQQIDGKIIVAASVYDATDYEHDISLLRFNSDGTPDATFGNAGTLILSASGLPENNIRIALSTDNKIIAVFHDYYSDPYNIHIHRVLSNGTPDNGFGTNGTKLLPFDFQDHYLTALALQADGKILLSGDFADQDSYNYYCWRLTSTGNPDNSFANNGIYINPQTASYFSESIGLHVTKDQKILLTGYFFSENSDSIYTCVTRLLPSGVPDNSFQTTGIGKYVQNSVDYNPAYPVSAVLHPDSSLYIAGNKVAFPDENVRGSFIIRIKENGNIDSSLSINGDGWNIFHTNAFSSYEGSISIDQDSIIYICGSTTIYYKSADLFLAAFKRLPADQGRVYTFTGNGNWNNASNWNNNTIPPSPLPDGSIIVIDPIPGATSILNVPQSINPGGSITVKTGSKLVIQGNLNIAN